MLFGILGVLAAVLLRWRGLPLVLVPETAALIAFVLAGMIERLAGRRPRV